MSFVLLLFMAEQKSNVPNQSECCNGCAFWSKFQHKCWYFWESKKGCTQFVNELDFDSAVNK